MGITDRQVHVFDAFGKLDAGAGGYGANDNYLAVNETQVKFNFWKYGLLDSDKVKFHQGLFQETAPQFKKYLQQNGKVLAVLRVDGNFYDSYYTVLDNLYGIWCQKTAMLFLMISGHIKLCRKHGPTFKNPMA